MTRPAPEDLIAQAVEAERKAAQSYNVVEYAEHLALARTLRAQAALARDARRDAASENDSGLSRIDP
jgi:hypothetical protein